MANETSGIGNLGSLVNGLGIEKTSGAARTAKAASATEAKSIQQDQTTLSPAAGALAQAVNGDDTRMEKVAALQKAIADGSYNVPSTAVADKLISSMLK